MDLPKKKKDRDTLLDIFQEVLMDMGGGDKKKMIEKVKMFAVSNEKEFFKIYASLEPKNVKIKSEGKLFYINLAGGKDAVPEDMPEFNELDDVVAEEVGGDKLN